MSKYRFDVDPADPWHTGWHRYRDVGSDSKITVLKDAIPYNRGQMKIARRLYRDGMTVGELGQGKTPSIFARRCLRRDHRKGIIRVEGGFPTPWMGGGRKKVPTPSPARG